MAGHHELKVWPAFFDAIVRGDKRFEVRSTDGGRRDFQTGDTIRLREWDPTAYPAEPPAAPPWATPPQPAQPRAPGLYTGRECVVEVTYILHRGFGLPENMVVMAITTPDLVVAGEVGE